MTLAAGLRYARGHWTDPLYRQSYLMLASTGVSAGTGLVFWVVAAHRTRPDVLGTAAGLVAANGFLSYLTSFALPYAMLRYGASEQPVAGMLNASLVVSAAASLLAAGAFALVAPLCSPALAGTLHRPVDALLFGLAGVGAATSLLLDNLLAARRRAAMVLARNTAAGVVKLLPLGLAGLDARRLYLAATLPALVTALAVVPLLPGLVPGYRLRAPWTGPLPRAAASFALRNTAGSLLSGAPQFVLPLIAVIVLGPRQNAFFYVAWSIAQIVYLIPVVVANVTLSQGGTGAAGALAARAGRFSLLLLAPLGLGGLLLTSLVLHLYGGEYARTGATALRLLLLAAGPWAAVAIAQARLRIEHRFAAVTVLTGCLCVASLALPVALAPGLGGNGMALGWLVGVAGAAVLAWRLAGTRA